MLVRTWSRRLYGGVATAALVPGLLLAALITMALAGGFARVGVLGQVFAGPPAPSGPGAAALARATRPLPPQVLAALSASTAVTAAPTAARQVRPATRRFGVGQHSVASQRVVRTEGSAGGHHGGTGHTPPAPNPPPSHPPKHPTVIDGIVTVGTSVTSQVPGPAGSAATQTLQTVGTTANQILPPPPPASP